NGIESHLIVGLVLREIRGGERDLRRLVVHHEGLAGELDEAVDVATEDIATWRPWWIRQLVVVSVSVVWPKVQGHFKAQLDCRLSVSQFDRPRVVVAELFEVPDERANEGLAILRWIDIVLG